MTVPQGTVAEILEWVGDDPGRAQEALDAEYSGAGRSTLITQLEAIATKEATPMTEPEAPDLVLDTRSEDVTVSAVHRRDADVTVPEYDDLNQVEAIPSDPVEYFQVASSPSGAVFSFNGAAYALQPDQVGAFRAALNSVVVGLTL